MALPSDLTDGECTLLQPFFPPPSHVGRPRKWPLRGIVEAFLGAYPLWTCSPKSGRWPLMERVAKGDSAEGVGKICGDLRNPPSFSLGGLVVRWRFLLPQFRTRSIDRKLSA